MSMFSESILQFGTGRFLRAFVDRFVHEANVGGQNIGSVVIVQSTGTDVADQLNASRGIYHIAVRGLEDGHEVRRDEVASVSRALAASREWDEVLKVATSPELTYIVSNTTEKGYDLVDSDRADTRIPASFPAKLLGVLRSRFEAGLPPLTLIPCELRDNQADELRDIVLNLAGTWKLPAPFIDYMGSQCVWLNTLVDRIVVEGPKDHPLTGKDPLMVMAEPFAFFALQSKPGAGPFVHHPAIVRTPDVRPYFLRKVRILNAAHTALVTRARQRPHQTVIEAMRDPELAGWLERLLLDEIVPAVRDQVDGAELFAQQTLERFRNPFLAHKIADILKNHDMKVAIRLAPSRDDFRRKFGREPRLLNDILRENGL